MFAYSEMTSTEHLCSSLMGKLSQENKSVHSSLLLAVAEQLFSRSRRNKWLWQIHQCPLTWRPARGNDQAGQVIRSQVVLWGLGFFPLVFELNQSSMALIQLLDAGVPVSSPVHQGSPLLAADFLGRGGTAAVAGWSWLSVTETLCIFEGMSFVPFMSLTPANEAIKKWRGAGQTQ